MNLKREKRRCDRTVTVDWDSEMSIFWTRPMESKAAGEFHEYLVDTSTGVGSRKETNASEDNTN